MPNAHLVILIPIYNDWLSLARLVVDLDEVLAQQGMAARLIAIDDGSTLAWADAFSVPELKAIEKVEILELRRNLGHQRALAIGLAYVHVHVPCDAVVVMDGDGEDDPRDVPRLVAKMEETGGKSIVFAERTRRSESLVFRILYGCFKLLHRLLTGKSVRVGNFSIIPRARLASLVVVSEMWNHYAAAAFNARQPYCTIPTHRGNRYCGRSSMNYVALVVHGLSAISVYSETVGVRLLVVAAVLIASAVLGALGVVTVRLVTDWAIPGWATGAFGLLVIIALQGVMLAFVLSFVVLGGRTRASFLPIRDFGYFVAGLEEAYPGLRTSAPEALPEVLETPPRVRH